MSEVEFNFSMVGFISKIKEIKDKQKDFDSKFSQKKVNNPERSSN
jgi:hypothetical protein